MDRAGNSRTRAHAKRRSCRTRSRRSRTRPFNHYIIPRIYIYTTYTTRYHHYMEARGMDPRSLGVENKASGARCFYCHWFRPVSAAGRAVRHGNLINLSRSTILDSHLIPTILTGVVQMPHTAGRMSRLILYTASRSFGGPCTRHRIGSRTRHGAAMIHT